MGLDLSEIALLFFGFVLVAGLVGEYAESEKWKRHVKIFEMLVIIGVAGELFADGGVFLFSAHLQTISENEISVLRNRASQQELRAAELEKEAAGAQKEAEKARREADSFELEIAKARKGSSEALERAEKAEENLGNARKDAALANERAAEANKIAEDERLARAKIEEKLAPRTLTEEQQKRIEAKVAPFSGTPFELAVDPEPEAISLVTIIDSVLRSANWLNKESENKSFRFAFDLASGSKVEQVYGSGVTIGMSKILLIKRYRSAAEALTQALRAEGIKTTLEYLPDSDPSPNNVHVIIGSK
jgi:hypothetical protein